jgi:hypothetical protein
VGEVPILKRKGIKRLSIRIKSDGKVKMTIPNMVSYKTAIKFLEEKQNWILKTRKEIQEKKSARQQFDENKLPKTRYHEFTITPVNINEYSFKLSPGLCEIFIPEDSNIYSEEIQQWIHKAFIETLRKEAKIILVGRCKELAASNGFKINSVRVKNMKTRWGSCSNRGNINLNIHLMQLPKYLSDYVIFHELVHTIHHNHSAVFWKDLDKYVGNSKTLAKEVREWGRKILH